MQRRNFFRSLFALSATGVSGLTGQASAQTAVTPTDNRHFAEVIGYKLEEHIRTARFAILPLGSVEYHGPSGPASTDTVLAKGIAPRLASKYQASIFPTIEFVGFQRVDS